MAIGDKMATEDKVALLEATILQLNSTLVKLVAKESETSSVYEDALPRIFNLICAIFVFCMQVGFSLLEAGTVRTKNTRAIMVKNVLDTCVCAIAFWMFGYAIGFGSGSSIIGWNYSTEFESSNDIALFPSQEQGHWFFQFTFAATSSTIIAGAMAERTQLGAYLIYNFVLSSVIYPVIAHIIWARDGFLSAQAFRNVLGTSGVIDTAGSMVVHVTGGVTSLVGAYLVGPRIGRFTIDGKLVRFKPHSLIFTAAGTILLWFGFYGFNAGSVYVEAGHLTDWVEMVARICVNTTLAAAASGITVFFIMQWRKETVGMDDIFNGVIGGLVAACATCSVVEPYASVVIGFGAAVSYLFGAWVILKLRIDDVVMAAPTHLFCGSWGAVAVGLFATKKGVQTAFAIEKPHAWGLFYGGGGQQLGVQILGLLLVYAWVGIATYVLFYLMAYFGALRVARHEEEVGMDVAFHGAETTDEAMHGGYKGDRRQSEEFDSRKFRTGEAGMRLAIHSMRHRLSSISRRIPQGPGVFLPWAMGLKGRGASWRQMKQGKALQKTAFGQFTLAMHEANYVMEDMGEVEVSGSGVYMGVHDGHGGNDCALFLRENLYKNMIECFLQDRGVVSTVGIDQAFKETDAQFMKAVREHFQKAPHLATIGACSVVAVATGSMLYVANVGDCRAVLARSLENGQVVAVQLSHDHNVNDEAERIAYMAEHPDDPNIVTNERGRHRIKGKLQVTRAFGDCFMKAADLNQEPLFPRFRVPEPFTPPLISAKPHVSVHALEKEDAFLILASDGLWDYVSNQEATDIVLTYPRKEAAKKLIREALERAAEKHEIPFDELVAMSMGPRRDFHDDITVIVFFFDHASRARKRQPKNLFWEQSLSLKGGQEVQLALKTQKDIVAQIQSHEEMSKRGISENDAHV